MSILLIMMLQGQLSVPADVQRIGLAWGECAKAVVAEQAASMAPAEVIAAQALAHCASEESALQAIWARRFGAAVAQEKVSGLRDNLRLLMISKINRDRAGH
jgi:hypothetical protein